MRFSDQQWILKWASVNDSDYFSPQKPPGVKSLWHFCINVKRRSWLPHTCQWWQLICCTQAQPYWNLCWINIKQQRPWQAGMTSAKSAECLKSQKTGRKVCSLGFPWMRPFSCAQIRHVCPTASMTQPVKDWNNVSSGSNVCSEQTLLLQNGDPAPGFQVRPKKKTQKTHKQLGWKTASRRETLCDTTPCPGEQTCEITTSENFWLLHSNWKVELQKEKEGLRQGEVLPCDTTHPRSGCGACELQHNATLQCVRTEAALRTEDCYYGVWRLSLWAYSCELM